MQWIRRNEQKKFEKKKKLKRKRKYTFKILPFCISYLR